ncbi:helix-turn-helix domain-containing protein [Acinetobacter sp.]
MLIKFISIKINKAYPFRLEPDAEQAVVLNKLVDSTRLFGIRF